jgi:membrane fusion protein, multidrug efflux system
MRLLSKTGLFSLLPLVLLSGCAQENQAAEPTPVTGELKRAEAAKVRVLPVSRQEMQRALETTTVVEAERSVLLQPQISGIVQEVLAEEGDEVKAGQVLARLDQRDAQAALEDSRIALQEAKDNAAKGEIARRDAEGAIKKATLAFEQAKRDFDRNEKARMISALDIEKLKLAMDTAEQDRDAAVLARDRSEIEGRASATAIERAELAVKRAEVTFSYTEITAPFAGVLTDRKIQVGHNVGAATEAFNLVDLSDLRTRFYRPQRELALFTGLGAKSDGDGPANGGFQSIEVTATSEALPGLEFGGVIERISPNIDSTSGSFRLTVRLDEESGGVRLLPGMLLRLRMVTERHHDAITVSKRALRREGETTILFVVEEGKARRVQVDVGFSSDDIVEVFPLNGDALDVGMEVVVVGNRDLEDGHELEIRPWDDEEVEDEEVEEDMATQEPSEQGAGQ